MPHIIHQTDQHITPRRPAALTRARVDIGGRQNRAKVGFISKIDQIDPRGITMAEYAWRYPHIIHRITHYIILDLSIKLTSTTSNVCDRACIKHVL